MSVKIRFTRMGKPKNPFYRIVVMDSRKSRDSEYLDKLGHFNPLVKKEERSQVNFHLEREKILSWLQKGAQPTQVVLDLLKEEKLWEEFSKQKPKKKKSKKRKSHSTPISEMLKRREEKKKVEEAKAKALKKKSLKEEEKGSKVSSETPEAKEEVKPEEAPPPETKEEVANTVANTEEKVEQEETGESKPD